MTNTEQSGIQKVSFYIATPAETCDRCSAGIKYVSLVSYADGSVQRYGSECINKILNHAPTLKNLYAINVKILKQYVDSSEVLSRDPKDMLKGREYFDSGLYFIADDKGKDIFTNHWFFHPDYDQEKNHGGDNYVVTNPAEARAKCIAEIESGKQFFAKEVTRIESFLAKILRKALDKTTAVA